jgi:hypothetical protein
MVTNSSFIVADMLDEIIEDDFDLAIPKLEFEDETMSEEEGSARTTTSGMSS